LADLGIVTQLLVAEALETAAEQLLKELIPD